MFSGYCVLQIVSTVLPTAYVTASMASILLSIYATKPLEGMKKLFFSDETYL
jgi:hypothetical protein